MTSYRHLTAPLKKRACALLASFPCLGLMLVLGLSGCSDIPGAGQAPAPETFTFGGALYVTNSGDGSLLVFDSQDEDRDGIVNQNDACPNTPAGASVDSEGCAASETKSAGKTQAFVKAVNTPTPRLQEGNISPTRRFPESVAAPSGIFLDRTNDTLYVANTGQNAIAIYEKASTLSPPVSATCVIAGDKTLLDKPFGISYDAVNDRIFVANRDSNSVVAFDLLSCAGSLAGNIAPSRRLIIAGQTPPSFPRSLAIDTNRNLLYVSTTGNDSILVYENPGTLGGSPSQCLTDLSPCSGLPNRVIGPHSGPEDASKLELPFGIFIDSQNDRLYVANTGLNKPAVFIYENASTRNSLVNQEVPERVIAGLNTQLTLPAGIDVDVAAGRVHVVNNNSPNNVNQSAGNNVDSPSLVVYNDILKACPAAPTPCNITPDNRIGGDVHSSAGTTLASPIGIAIDPDREITYIANTGGNNILVYFLGTNSTPIKLNASIITTGGNDNTNVRLEEPSTFYYDEAIDRLYIGNFGVANGRKANVSVVVYDKIGTKHFNDTKPDWSIDTNPDFDFNRGFHIDKQRGYLLVLNASSPQFSVYCIPLPDGQFNASCTNPSTHWIGFPVNNSNAQNPNPLTPPVRFNGFTAGLTANGPSALAVDETRGDVYIADKNSNAIFVYNLISLTVTRTISGGNTKLSQPAGLTYDPTRDILYVSNIGNNTLLSFGCTTLKNGNPFVCDGSDDTKKGASQKDDNVAPDRTFTTETASVPDADKLKKPLSPYVDANTNQLFLISATQDAVFIYNDADLLGDDLNNERIPDKKISGANTLFDFSSPRELNRTSSALYVKNDNGLQTLFIGQPESPLCVKTAFPNNSCPSGAFMAFGLEGRIAPNQIWSGGGGAFSAPTGIGIDTTRGVLYIVNQATNTLSRMTGTHQVNITTSVKTDLGNIQLDRPAGLFIDSTENRLYLSNASSILAFNGADQLADGSSPSQTITHAQLNNPRGLKVDSTKKRLYVASTGNHSVLAFKVDGGALFDAVLSGPNTKLLSPIDVAIDTTRDLLYVLNGGATEILVFESAAALSGNVAPSRVIRGGDLNANNVTGDPGGNNFMVRPSALFVDPILDLLYLADPGAEAVYMFPNASTVQGQAEHKSLAGDNTGLKQPSALFVVSKQSP